MGDDDLRDAQTWASRLRKTMTMSQVIDPSWQFWFRFKFQTWLSDMLSLWRVTSPPSLWELGGIWRGKNGMRCPDQRRLFR